MILLIDNYDSFSYNLYQLAGAQAAVDGIEVKVVRNDALDIAQIRALAPQGILLSPGPGRPEDAGICIEVVQKLGRQIPILGVCLGHQAICTAYGGVVGYAGQLMHGKQSVVDFDRSCALFAACPPAAPVARYHSLAAEPDSLPDCLKITARVQQPDGEVMAVCHTRYPVYGVQFHPESIMTPDGALMLKNYIEICKKFAANRGKEYD